MIYRRGSLTPFFFQAEDGIRAKLVTGVQTCALPISGAESGAGSGAGTATVLRRPLRAGPADRQPRGAARPRPHADGAGRSARLGAQPMLLLNYGARDAAPCEQSVQRRRG